MCWYSKEEWCIWQKRKKKKKRHLSIGSGKSSIDRNECSKGIISHQFIVILYLRESLPIRVLCASSWLFPFSSKVFDYSCFAHATKHQQGKLDPKAIKCILVGYPSTQKGYKCYLLGEHRRSLLAMMSLSLKIFLLYQKR